METIINITISLHSTKHIPTAVHFNAFHQTIPSEMYPRPVPDTDVMQDHIRALGVNSNSHVVLYDNNGQCGFFIASRAWWTLKVRKYLTIN